MGGGVEIEKYIKQNKLPKIPDRKLAVLNALISLSEVSDAINQAKIGNSPGPDGITAKYKNTCNFRINIGNLR